LGHSDVFQAFKTFCLESGNDHLLTKVEDILKLFVHSKELTRGLPLKKSALELFKATGRIPIGQIAFKEEAAGKLRNFAIVDIWTQSLLRPLHDALFGLLQSLPNDGTFDQDASFKRCVKKAKESKCAFGYDLSAATDRLPMSLQVTILTVMFGSKLAEAWRDLLVGREYIVPKNDYGISQPFVKYAVGQPMGALSSWAMLAVTHHIIVQYCAWSSYPVSFFTKYKG